MSYFIFMYFKLYFLVLYTFNFMVYSMFVPCYGCV